MKLKNKLAPNPSVCYMRHVDKILELLGQNDCRELLEGLCG